MAGERGPFVCVGGNVGHWHPTNRPSTKKWHAVTDAVASGAAAPVVVSAASAAVGEQLLRAGLDSAVLDVAALLFELPRAAASANFADALGALGVVVSPEPGASELACAVSDTIDRIVDGRRSRTDLSELAQMAALEALTATIRDRSAGRMPTSPAYVQEKLAACVRGGAFSALAEAFLARLTDRWVGYQLGRELASHVGAGSRFEDGGAKRAFDLAASEHAREAARAVRPVADRWLADVGTGRDVTRDDVSVLIQDGVAAIASEFRRAAAS